MNIGFCILLIDVVSCFSLQLVNLFFRVLMCGFCVMVGEKVQTKFGCYKKWGVGC